MRNPTPWIGPSTETTPSASDTGASSSSPSSATGSSSSDGAPAVSGAASPVFRREGARVGFVPCGLVVGSCVFAAGTQYDWVVKTGEVTQLSEEGVEEQSVIPVTLAVVPKIAMSLTYAANFAAEVRLVALPNDVGTNRSGEVNDFDAGELGGKAVLEGTDQ